jgi:hypothetical protein
VSLFPLATKEKLTIKLSLHLLKKKNE